ncbi:MAG: methyltransferase domain-containing protein [Chitinophagia bacterium]
MFTWFIKGFSYIWPVTIKNYSSQYSGELYIRYFLGKKVLDCKHTNYSFGGLQKVLKRALELLPFNPDTKKILILGLGAGSVVATIRKQHSKTAHVTGVEIDATILQIAREEFGIVENSLTKLVQEDAIVFMANNADRYDLIVIDLFIIDTIPEATQEASFLKQLVTAMEPGGYLVFNTIPETLSNETLDYMISFFESSQLTVRVMKKWGYSNNILLVEKQSLA